MHCWLALSAVIAVAVTVITAFTYKAPSSLLLAPTNFGGDCGENGLSRCVELPLCDSTVRLTLLGHVACAVYSAPLGFATEEYRQYVAERLQVLGRHHIKGQAALKSVTALVAQKLRNMPEPLILHFAGDNGVGKTKLAEVVSLSVAQRCKKGSVADECRLGDSTLELSGTSYAGISVKEFRSMVVPVIAKHALTHRGNGVVIINELSSLEPEKVEVLLPLLGRGSYFPEFSNAPLTGLIVIITTDFGQEGRTRGKSLAEMRAFINAEFQELYHRHSTSMIRTFPFLPISLDTAAEIVHMAVHDIGCSARSPYSTPRRACRVSQVFISEDAVSWIVEKVKPVLSAENGRALVQEVATSVRPLLREWEDAYGGVAECHISVNDHGDLEAVAA